MPETQEYAELVAARAPALLRLAVMLTGSRSEAEDLLQATLVRTQAHAHRIPAMGAPRRTSAGRWSTSTSRACAG
ncbi:MAG: sigma factor [Nocardioides sp.]